MKISDIRPEVYSMADEAQKRLAGRFAGMPCRQPELEEIMVHLEKEEAEQ